MAELDLVIRGGEVFDPASGRRGHADLGFAGGSLAAIDDDLGGPAGTKVVDVADCLVVPGLVDIHAHVFEGVGDSVNAGEVCFGRGTTTVADGGSAGANLFQAFRRLTGSSRARVLAWLNLSTIGQVDTRVGELLALPHADVGRAVATARANPDLIVGFKARLSTYVVGGTCLPVLRLLRECGDVTGLPVMVHIGDTGEPLGEILDLLRSGDIVTHILTGRKNGILDGSGTIHPEVFAARERGVLFDASRGRNHEAFPVLRAAVEQGLLPDTISTDLVLAATEDPEYGLPLMATHFLAFGVPLEEIIPRVTLNPARAMGRPDLGRLQPGGVGDVTILRVETGRFSLNDVDGRSHQTDRRIVAVGVVKDGVYTRLRP